MSDTEILDSESLAPGVKGRNDGKTRGEITFAELFRIFADRVYLMVAVFSICVGAAIAFLWLVEPVYRAQVFLIAPTSEDVILRDERGVSVATMQLTQDAVLLDVSESRFSSVPLESLEFEDYSPATVFAELLKNLQSRAVRREYYDEMGVYQEYLRLLGPDSWDVDRMFEKRFNPDIEVHLPGLAEDQNFAQISYEFEDPEYAAEMLNGFVDFVNRKTVAQLYEVVDLSLQGQIQGLKDEIDIRRKQAQTLISDQLAKLNESAVIAQKLGLIEGMDSILPSKVSSSLVVNTVESPDYLRGEKALRAEIEAIEARKNQDVFVPGLRQLQTRLDFLSGIRISLERIRSARIDQPASPPHERVFPRPAVTVVLSVVAGIIFAFFFALVAHAWNGVRTQLRH